MSLQVRRKYKFMLLAAALMVAALLGIRLSDAFNLASIETIPAGFINTDELNTIITGQNIFSISEEELVNKVIGDKKVLKADLEFKFPNEIEITLNDVKPLALVCCDGEMFVLGECGRMVKFDNETTEFNFPIVSGAKQCTAYRPIRDNQLILIYEQLKQLRVEDFDFYLAISSIDLSNSEYVTITMDGLKPYIKMFAGDLTRNMKYLKTFLLEFNPDLGEVGCLDFRLEGQIIAAK